MEDLTSWVAREAQNMGIDFACLSPQARNNIISILMSGLENGFRSRMDIPDLRFAKRKGIGKQNQILSSQSSSSNNLNTNQTSDSSCAMPNNDDQINCPITDLNCPIDNPITCPTYETTCPIDTMSSCPIDSINCPQIDTACEENDGSTCDNYCFNNTGQNCTDNQLTGCTDNHCQNNNNCGDGSISLGCTDNTCINNDGCSDVATGSYKCSDGGCKNTQNGNQCTDVGSCQDDGCINSKSCTDTGSSVTVYCSDDSCTNSKSPQATYGCFDFNFCSDIGCANYSKNIAQCTDSMVGAGNSCTDNPCSNWGGVGSKCLNDGNSCTDSICTNNPYCEDNPGAGTCNDAGTACYDLGGSACSDGCSDRNFNNEGVCTDTSTSCSNNAHVCLDQDCTDDEGCQNKGDCVDRGMDGHSCTDYKCRNEDPAVCSDRGSCTDNECVNTGLCTDDEGCSDTSCSNEGVCQDFISPGCDNSPGSDTGRCSTLTKNDTCGDALC